MFNKILWGLMGFYLLNMSVDTADPNPEHIPEDLSINDQESMVEIVLEMVLGFEDTIKEYDDHDTEDQNKKRNVKIDLLELLFKGDKMDDSQSIEIKKTFPAYEARLIRSFNEIDSPPPKG